MLTLMKYDFIEISKKILPIWLIILLLSLIQNFSFLNKSNEAISILVSVMSAAIPTAIFFALIVASAVWFNSSMYTDRAYLTFTLPRTNKEIIFSKVITSFIYVILSLIYALVLVFITYYMLGDKATLLDGAKIVVDFSLIKKVFYLLMTGQSVMIFSYIMLIFFSVSIASMLPRFKKLGGIAVFILTKIVMDLTLIRVIANGFGLDYTKLQSQSNMMMGIGKLANDFTDILYTQLYVNLVFVLVTTILYIISINLIVSKKLNL